VCLVEGSWLLRHLQPLWYAHKTRSHQRFMQCIVCVSGARRSVKLPRTYTAFLLHFVYPPSPSRLHPATIMGLVSMLSSGVYQTGLAIHITTQAIFTGLMGGESEGFVPSTKEAKTHRRHMPHPRPSLPATTPAEGSHVHHEPLYKKVHKKEQQQGAFSKAAQRVKEGVESALPSRGKGKPTDLPALLIPGASAMTTQMEIMEERPAEQQPAKSEEAEHTKLPSAQEAQGEKKGETAAEQQETERVAVGEKKEDLMLPKEREGCDEYEEGKSSALFPFEERPSASLAMPGSKEEEHFMTPPKIRPTSSSSRLGGWRKRQAPTGGFTSGPPQVYFNTKEVKCSIM